VQGFGQAKVSSNVLKQVEQTDLIQYGLIPEFVGRFPIISSLQVSTSAHPITAVQNHAGRQSPGCFWPPQIT
jgi:ATP-dependent protease Clp ATPase subunit